MAKDLLEGSQNYFADSETLVRMGMLNTEDLVAVHSRPPPSPHTHTTASPHTTSPFLLPVAPLYCAFFPLHTPPSPLPSLSAPQPHRDYNPSPRRTASAKPRTHTYSPLAFP